MWPIWNQRKFQIFPKQKVFQLPSIHNHHGLFQMDFFHGFHNTILIYHISNNTSFHCPSSWTQGLNATFCRLIYQPFLRKEMLPFRKVFIYFTISLIWSIVSLNRCVCLPASCWQRFREWTRQWTGNSVRTSFLTVAKPFFFHRAL